MERTSPSSDWTELLRGLNDAGVRFLVVGAHAVGQYATPRATGDLDIFIERTPENAARTMGALLSLGAPLGGLTIGDLQCDDLIFMFGAPPLRVDILTDISGVAFSTAWASRVESSFGGVPVAYIGRDALLANKRASGRPKDLADIEAIEGRDG